MRMSELPGGKVVLCTPSQDKSEEKGTAWNDNVTDDGYKFSGEIGRRAKKQEEREHYCPGTPHFYVPRFKIMSDRNGGITQRNSGDEDSSYWYGVA